MRVNTDEVENSSDLQLDMNLGRNHVYNLHDGSSILGNYAHNAYALISCPGHGHA